MIQTLCRCVGTSLLLGSVTVSLVVAQTPPTSEPAAAKPAEPKESAKPAEPAKADDAAAGTALFNGRNLDGWEVSKFGGGGEIYVEDGQIVLDFGASLTGIRYRGEVPPSNYELSLEGQRSDGTDFFCALTFPVGQEHCSLILGGWGGAVVGLSSIDGKDASENDTTQYIGFKKGQWYSVKVRVTDERIQVELDGKQIIDQARAEHRFSVRREVDLSRPLGIAAWETRARIRNIRLRKL
ncbi:MAG: family 16 glycoside hydrolase [Pirellulales bacterium]